MSPLEMYWVALFLAWASVPAAVWVSGFFDKVQTRSSAIFGVMTTIVGVAIVLGLKATR